MRGSFIGIATALVLVAGMTPWAMASEGENSGWTEVTAEAPIEKSPEAESPAVETPVVEKKVEKCGWRRELAWREWRRLPRGERIARERNGRHPSQFRC